MKIGARVNATVATCGQPQAALAETVGSWSARAGLSVLHVAVLHDDGCPCLDGHSIRFCSCELVDVEGTRVA